MCGEYPETQRHFMEECQQIKEKIKTDRTNKIKYEDIFKDGDISKVENIVNQIIEIEELENRRKNK